MKNVIITLVSSVLFSSFAFSQISKTEIESMLSELVSSVDKIESVYIGNTKTFYTDGSWKVTDAKYTKTKGNVVSLTEKGLKITYTPEGVKTSIIFFPYDNIGNLELNATGIVMYLKD